MNLAFCVGTFTKNVRLALMILTLPLNKKRSSEMPFKQTVKRFELIQRSFLFYASGIWNGFFLFYWLLSLAMKTSQLRLFVWKEFPRRRIWFLYFGRCNFWAEYSTVLLSCLWTSSWSLIFTYSWRRLALNFSLLHFSVCIYNISSSEIITIIIICENGKI